MRLVKKLLGYHDWKADGQFHRRCTVCGKRSTSSLKRVRHKLESPLRWSDVGPCKR